MSDEISQKLWLGIAAIGGGLMSEGIRRLAISADKAADISVQKEQIQLDREEVIAEKEKKLREALWAELERTMKKVDELEKKLNQATEVIETLNKTNIQLTRDVEELSRQLTKFTTGIK